MFMRARLLLTEFHYDCYKCIHLVYQVKGDRVYFLQARYHYRKDD